MNFSMTNTNTVSGTETQMENETKLEKAFAQEADI
jgi:hypothetical protein